MNFIIWLVVGGLIGWIARQDHEHDAQQGVLLNIVVASSARCWAAGSWRRSLTRGRSTRATSVSAACSCRWSAP